MINKIKDFLKRRLGSKRGRDSSDQDDLVDDDLASNATDFISPPKGLDDDYSGYTQLKKTRIADRMTAIFSGLTGRLSQTRIAPNGGPRPEKGAAPGLGRSIERFLSRGSREPIHQAFLALLIFLVTYSLGKTVALVMRGNPNVASPSEQTVSIPLNANFNASSLSRVQMINLFRTEGTAGPSKTKMADAKCEKAQQASNLPIKLVNTTVLQDTIKSLASVQVRGARALQEFRVGEQIDNLAKIFKISRLELLIRNLETGMCESISSDRLSTERPSSIAVMSPAASREFLRNKKMPGIENMGNKFIISQDLLKDKMKDIGSILTQARAVKIQNPDGSLAFKMTEMDPEGLFPYLGLQDQDIITSIDGEKIYDMNQVMQLFARIQNLEKLQLGIKREGSDSVQEYSIKK